MAIDYTSFNTGDNKNAKNSTDKQWWNLSKDEMAAAISGGINFLQKRQETRRAQMLASARLYGNLSIMGLNGYSYSRLAGGQGGTNNRITYNVVQSAVDTIVSKISKNRPSPLFLTSGGDYKLQRKAKKLTKFCEGIFYENKANEMMPACFRDACVFGTGAIHVFSENSRVKWERVLSSEIFVDEVEGFYGFPRQLHRIKNVDRQVLLEAFPKKAKSIELCNETAPDAIGGTEHLSDIITVRESWHLPSGEGATDGRHVISIDNDWLLVEDYYRDKFPFAFDHWSKRLFGFWGQSIPEQIQSIQLEINKLLYLIQRSYHLAGSFKILIENGSKIVKEYLNNDVGSIITYAGTKPDYIVPPIIPPEIYQHLLTLKNAAYEQIGVSQLSAASKKPNGLDSGKALREFNDIETDRFMSVGHDYENLALDLADLSIEEAKSIYDQEGSYAVKSPNKSSYEKIDWKDIKLSQDSYTMKCYPVSSFPKDPAGRLATIQEYIQAGFISKRAGQRLLDFPDLEQVDNLMNAPENYINEVLEKIVEEGEYTAPEPEDDLILCKELALEYIAQAKCNGLEEEKLEMLRQFLQKAKDLSDMAMQGLPPEGGSPAQAVAEKPPVSELIPNVPGAA